jgi:hypothetical protein
MQGMRHHRTAASAWLVSALALLALVGFPALAQGAVSPEYTDAPPQAVGDNGGSSGGSSAGTPARKSSTPGGGGSASSQAGGGNVSKSAGNNSSSNSGGTANADGGGGSGQQGSPANGTAEGKLGDAQNLGQSGSPTRSESDGGSSPLIPILIAIFVLAAISLAVVLIRQRRQRGTPGEPASSKAG